MPKKGSADKQKTAQSRYWTPDEHDRFLEALERYGHKDVKSISGYVNSRNPTQVRTHAQKFFLRLGREAQRSREKLEADSTLKRAAPADDYGTPSKRSKTSNDADMNEDDSANDPTNDYVPPGWTDSDYDVFRDVLDAEYSLERDVTKKCTEIARKYLPRFTVEELEHIYYKVYKDDVRQRTSGDDATSPSTSGSNPTSAVNSSTTPLLAVPSLVPKREDPFAAPPARSLRVAVSPARASLANAALLALSPTASVLPIPFSPRNLRPLTPLASPGGQLLTPTFQALLDTARLPHLLDTVSPPANAPNAAQMAAALAGPAPTSDSGAPSRFNFDLSAKASQQINKLIKIATSPR